MTVVRQSHVNIHKVLNLFLVFGVCITNHTSCYVPEKSCVWFYSEPFQEIFTWRKTTHSGDKEILHINTLKLEIVVSGLYECFRIQNILYQEGRLYLLLVLF